MFAEIYGNACSTSAITTKLGSSWFVEVRQVVNESAGDRHVIVVPQTLLQDEETRFEYPDNVIVRDVKTTSGLPNLIMIALPTGMFKINFELAKIEKTNYNPVSVI